MIEVEVMKEIDQDNMIIEDLMIEILEEEILEMTDTIEMTDMIEMIEMIDTIETIEMIDMIETIDMIEEKDSIEILMIEEDPQEKIPEDQIMNGLEKEKDQDNFQSRFENVINKYSNYYTIKLIKLIKLINLIKLIKLINLIKTMSI